MNLDENYLHEQSRGKHDSNFVTPTDTFSPKSWATGHSTQKARQLNNTQYINNLLQMQTQMQEELNSEIQRRRILRCKRSTKKQYPGTDEKAPFEPSSQPFETSGFDIKGKENCNSEAEPSSINPEQGHNHKSQMSSLSIKLNQGAFQARKQSSAITAGSSSYEPSSMGF
jgi:hypothetical protein